MAELRHRMVETNGIDLHIAEQGTGPVALMLRGFPESSYPWRHQLPALAAAGYEHVRNLTLPSLIPGCGHWTQEEKPAKVNAARDQSARLQRH